MKLKDRILFITQWEYDDGLIQSTLSYINIIKNITSHYCYLVTASKVAKVKVKKKGDIVVIEVPVRKKLLFTSWFLNILLLRKIINKKKVRIIHGWCTPACSVGVALKLMNRKLTFIADSYEPHSESMVETGTWKRANIKFHILFFLEKIQTRNADFFVFSAPGMQDYILKKYGNIVTNYFVKPTCVNLSKFSFTNVKNEALLNKLDLQGKITCVYAGKLGGLYMENEVFEFIKCCEQYWGKERFRFLLLSGQEDSYINEKKLKFNIASDTIIKQFVPHNEVPSYMGLADFAFSPVKPVPSRLYCSPIKDAEYWAMGLPIVITNGISIDTGIIRENNIGAVLETLDESGYTNAIKHVESIMNNNSRKELYTKIRPIAEKYRNLEIAEKVYKTIYASV